VSVTIQFGSTDFFTLMVLIRNIHIIIQLTELCKIHQENEGKWDYYVEKILVFLRGQVRGQLISQHTYTFLKKLLGIREYIFESLSHHTNLKYVGTSDNGAKLGFFDWAIINKKFGSKERHHAWY
jgi:hypothetical protein